jgi:hypothetical protein
LNSNENTPLNFEALCEIGKKREEKERWKGGYWWPSGHFFGRTANSSKSSPTMTPFQTCPLDAPPKDKKAKVVLFFLFQIILFLFEDFSFYKMQSEKNQICNGKG